MRAPCSLAEASQADDKTRARVRFAVLQWIDAAAPSNFLALNPEAQKKAIDTQGESLPTASPPLERLQHGHLSQTDESAFEVGRNVATTEGSVVFENEFFQLLEYKPLTAKVHERPILFVPPCINKFYILDLQPENSLIRYAVGEGHRVFVVSWKNAGEDIAQRDLGRLHRGRRDHGDRAGAGDHRQEQINTLGFCIGGTILATALAVLAARGERPAASMTLLTTFLDFSDTGILDIFIDETAVRMREMTIGAQSAGGGSLLKGQELATTFSFLRPNELVWNYVVGNYLKGETPPPFDLLYWNSDGTNLPGPMYCWYLRNTYLENKLREPGALTVCGEKVDLGAIAGAGATSTPRARTTSCRGRAPIAAPQILKGKRRFVLGASGHIAGVINPPAEEEAQPLDRQDRGPAGRRRRLAGQARASIRAAGGPTGRAWLAPFGGKQVAAPKAPGSAR